MTPSPPTETAARGLSAAAMLSQLDGLGAADAREPALKAALMRQIGLLLCTNHKALLESAVSRLLDAAKPATDKNDAAAADEEQTGCAEALGTAASKHLDAVLDCLLAALRRAPARLRRRRILHVDVLVVFQSRTRHRSDWRDTSVNTSYCRRPLRRPYRHPLQAHLLSRPRRRPRRRRPTGAPTSTGRFPRTRCAAAAGGRCDDDAAATSVAQALPSSPPPCTARAPSRVIKCWTTY